MTSKSVQTWASKVSNIEKVQEERKIQKEKEEEEKKLEFWGYKKRYDKLDKKVELLNKKRKDFDLEAYTFKKEGYEVTSSGYIDKIEEEVDTLDNTLFYWVVLKKDSKARVYWDTNMNGGSYPFPLVNRVVKTKEEGKKVIQEEIYKVYTRIVNDHGYHRGFKLPMSMDTRLKDESQEYDFIQLKR